MNRLEIQNKFTKAAQVIQNVFWDIILIGSEYLQQLIKEFLWKDTPA